MPAAGGTGARRRAVRGVLGAGLALLVGGAVATAGPGDPDPTFGEVSGRSEEPRLAGAGGLARLADGGLVMVSTARDDTSSIAVARYDAAGRPVAGYGDDGVATVDVGRSVNVSGVTPMRDGLLVTGTSGDSAVLARLTAGGTLDPTFNAAGPTPGVLVVRVITAGTGGSCGIDCAGGGLNPGSFVIVGAGRPAATSGGGAVLGGAAYASTSGTTTTGSTAEQRFGWVLRVDGDGELVEGFGDGGVRRLEPDVLETVGGLLATTRGIVAAGSRQDDGQPVPVLVGLTDTGALDPAFGTDGVTAFTGHRPGRFSSLTRRSDGRLLAAGHTGVGGQDRVLVASTGAAGAPDATFGAGGTTVVAVPGHEATGQDVVADGLGRAWVVASATTTDAERLALVRLGTDGRPDPGFAPLGSSPGVVVLGALRPGQGAFPAGLVVDGPHRALVAASSYDPDTSIAVLAAFGRGANAVPQVQVQITPAKPVVGSALRFDATGTRDPDGDALRLRWSFEGRLDPGDGTVVERTAPGPGELPWRLEVTDAFGATEVRTGTVAVFAPGLPTDVGIEVLPPAGLQHDGRSFIEGQRLRLRATGAGAAAGGVDLRWSFGDGGPGATGAVVERAFTAAPATGLGDAIGSTGKRRTTFRVQLDAVAADGTTFSSSRLVTVLPNTKPVAQVGPLAPEVERGGTLALRSASTDREAPQDGAAQETWELVAPGGATAFPPGTTTPAAGGIDVDLARALGLKRFPTAFAALESGPEDRSSEAAYDAQQQRFFDAALALERDSCRSASCTAPAQLSARLTTTDFSGAKDVATKPFRLRERRRPEADVGFTILPRSSDSPSRPIFADAPGQPGSGTRVLLDLSGTSTDPAARPSFFALEFGLPYAEASCTPGFKEPTRIQSGKFYETLNPFDPVAGGVGIGLSRRAAGPAGPRATTAGRRGRPRPRARAAQTSAFGERVFPRDPKDLQNPFKSRCGGDFGIHPPSRSKVLVRRATPPKVALTGKGSTATLVPQPTVVETTFAQAYLTKDPKTGTMGPIAQSVAVTAYDDLGLPGKVRLDGLVVLDAKSPCQTVPGQQFGANRYTATCALVAEVQRKNGRGKKVTGALYATRRGIDVNGVRLRPAAGWLVVEDFGPASRDTRMYITRTEPLRGDLSGGRCGTKLATSKLACTPDGRWDRLPATARTGSGSPPVEVLAGEDPVAHFTLGARASDFLARTGLTPALEPIKDATFNGFDLVAESLRLELQDKGRSELTFKTRVPEAFAADGGKATSDVLLRGVNDGTADLGTCKSVKDCNATASADGDDPPPAKLDVAKDGKLTLHSGSIGGIPIPPGQTLFYDPQQDLFRASFSGLSPFPGYDASAELALQRGKLLYARGKVDGTIPLGGAPGVLDLKQLRFGVELVPETIIRAGVNFEAAQKTLTGTGDVEYRVAPKRLQIDARADLVGIGPLGRAQVVAAPGLFAFSAAVGKSFGEATFNASVAGAFGEDLAGASAFNIQGKGDACIFACLGIEALVSSKGIAACGDVPLPTPIFVRAGFGYRYTPSDLDIMVGSCDISPYAVPIKGAPAGVQLRSTGLPSCAPTPVPKSFEVPKGAPAFAVAVRSLPGTTPAIRLRHAASGRVVDAPDVPGGYVFAGPGDAVVDRNPVDATTRVLLAKPPAGTWAIEELPGSSPLCGMEAAMAEDLSTKALAPEARISKVIPKRLRRAVFGTPQPTVPLSDADFDAAKALARKAAAAEVARAAQAGKARPRAPQGVVVPAKALAAPDRARLRRLTLRAKLPRGVDRVVLVEEGPGVGQVLAGERRQSDGRLDVDLAFDPARGQPGKRSVVAYLLDPDGVPRRRLTVAKYAAPAPARLPAPAKLGIGRTAAGTTYALLARGPVYERGAVPEFRLTYTTSDGGRVSRAVLGREVVRLGPALRAKLQTTRKFGVRLTGVGPAASVKAKLRGLRAGDPIRVATAKPVLSKKALAARKVPLACLACVKAP